MSQLYTRATTWLYGTLTSPPIAGVLDAYEDYAPQGATDKDSVWIEYELMAPGDDVAEVAEQRIWTEFAFRVVACSRGRSRKALEPMADAIYTRLHRVSGSVAGGFVLSSVRTSEIAAGDLAQGVEYREIGGIFNLIVQPA